ncbi:MAG: sel1 repeat family protein [Robiginitomaculum sp.]|nr:sel1 repeat family protein [Robiginitomaculum sp.]
MAFPAFASNSKALKHYNNKDYQAALEIIQPNAENDDVWAQYMLGIMHQNGLGVTKNYSKASRWFLRATVIRQPEKAKARGALSSYYHLATIYEKGGYGVERDYAKAAKWYLELADQPIWADTSKQIIDFQIYAIRKLGFFYADGDGVKQDYKQAVKWLKRAAERGDANAQGRLGLLYADGKGVPLNPAAAKKWMQLSANSANNKAKVIVTNVIAELDVDGFLYARAKWREKFPAHMKPFGIVLGKRFPAELDYSSYQGDNTLLNNIYAKVKPQQEFPGKADHTQAGQRYFVVTSKISDTVYKVLARIDFNSKIQCRKALTAYFKNNLASASDPVVVADWSGANGFIADFNVGLRTINPVNPLRLQDADNLTGVRLILECSGKSGKIVFIHYPSVEKRIVESIEFSPWWNSFYDSSENPGERPDYMNPFGIALAQPLPIAQRQPEGEDNYISNIFDVSSPNMHKLFSKYTVYTSRLTNSVIRIWAEGRFNSKSQCNRALVVAAKGLVMKYSTQDSIKKTLKDIEPTDIPWNLSRLTLTPDDIYFDVFESAEKTSIYTQKNGQPVPDTAKAKYLVNVNLGCGSSSDGNYWEGFVEYAHPLSREIAGKELNVLNLYDLLY